MSISFKELDEDVEEKDNGKASNQRIKENKSKKAREAKEVTAGYKEDIMI